MADTNTATTVTDIHSGKTALADDFRTHFAGDGPITDKAKGFVKARPFASAALLGVAAMAVLGTLRGSRS